MRPLDGYPDSWGAQRASVFPHAGPASYVQVVPATPAGDTVRASEAGLKYFDFLVAGLTDSGTYRVEAIPMGPSSSIQGAPSMTYLLRWVVVATGAEVAAAVDLSAQVVRLLAVGPK